MVGKYKKNKPDNIQFLENWIRDLNEKNNLKFFFDDYHIDEIDPTIDRTMWVDVSLKIYADFHEYINTHYPMLDIMLCLDLGESNIQFNYLQSLTEKNLINLNEPPSIYLFNKKNNNIRETLQECIKLKNLERKINFNVFLKEEYEAENSSYHNILFLTQIKN